MGELILNKLVVGNSGKVKRPMNRGSSFFIKNVFDINKENHLH